MEEEAMSEDAMSDDVLDRVRRALGRSGRLAAAPVPPRIDESITRLLNGGEDLAAHFTRMCEENKMHVEPVAAAQLSSRLGEFLGSNGIKRVALSNGGLLERLSVPAALWLGGIEAWTWNQITLDKLYDFECGITDVDYAVAETGSLVERATAGHGRSLSLVPALHIAVVEASRIVPDLVDLFAALTRDGMGSAVTLITGPSKTSDIEMNLVIGVHGPMQVQVFLVT